MDIPRTFRRFAFAQVIIGIVSFCLMINDLQTLLAALVIGAGIYFVFIRHNRAVPKWVLLPATLLTVGWLALRLNAGVADPVLSMGYFMIWLQLLLLLGPKTNREYGEVLVLSLMLMIAASVRSVSVVYGLLLACYSVVALFTLLTLQMKVTADGVARSTPASDDPAPTDAPALVQGAAGRSARWHLRLTALLLGGVACGVAVFVFLIVPRASLQGQVSQNPALQRMQSRTVGYSRQVRLDQPGPTATDHNAVLHLRVTMNGEQAGSTATTFLVRGATLDRYDPENATWQSSPLSTFDSQRIPLVNDTAWLESPDIAERLPTYEAEFELFSPLSGPIMTLSPVIWIDAPGIDQVSYSATDGTVRFRSDHDFSGTYRLRAPAGEPSSLTRRSVWPEAFAAPAPESLAPEALAPLRQAVGDVASLFTAGSVSPDESAERTRERLWSMVTASRNIDRSAMDFWSARLRTWTYAAALLYGNRAQQGEVIGRFSLGWRGRSDIAEPLTAEQVEAALTMRYAGPGRYAAEWPVQTEVVRALAQSILAERGLSRNPEAESTPDDLMIARTLADYVRENHEYTLGGAPPPRGVDPTLAFLFDHRQGHCELYASALTALTRSIGLRSRMVVGFLATEFSGVGGYYVVRNSDAHAWTEIYCGEAGWRTFDPTPAGSGDFTGDLAEEGGIFAAITDLYRHVQFTWLGSIVTYDTQTRSRILGDANQRLGDLLGGAESNDPGWLDRLTDLATADGQLDPLSAALILVMLVAGGVMVVSAIGFLARRVRLPSLTPRKRVAGASRRRRRHLGFFFTMQSLLDKAGEQRPQWQTPLRFAEQLSQRQPERYAAVLPLTQWFYELRYGDRPLTKQAAAEIERHLATLEEALKPAQSKKAA